MGNYITADYIVVKNGLDDTTVEQIITAWEDFIHEFYNNIFYEETGYIFKFIGNNKVTIFTDILVPYNLCSITKIESINSEGELTEIDSTYYTFNEFSITRKTGGWKRTRYENYKVTCSIGNATTDINGNTNNNYKPETIKKILLILVNRDIAEVYGTSSGTAIIDTDKLQEYKYSAEQSFDYSYKRRIVDPNSATPTGIPLVDLLLNQTKTKYGRKYIKMFTPDTNPNNYAVEDDYYDEIWTL